MKAHEEVPLPKTVQKDCDIRRPYAAFLNFTYRIQKLTKKVVGLCENLMNHPDSQNKLP